MESGESATFPGNPRENSIDAFLASIVRSVADAFPGLHAEVLVFDQEENRFRAVAKSTPPHYPGADSDLHQEIAREVSSRGETVMRTTSEADLSSPADVLQHVGFPLHGDGGTLGVLSCCTRANLQIESTEMDRLRSFAEQAALALQKIRLEKDVERLKALLIQAERHRTLGAMMRGIAHDLNNVLGIIMTRAQLLMTNAKEPESLKDLENIERAAHQGSNCVRHILEFTKSSHELNVSAIDLHDLVEEVVTLTQGRWRDEPSMHGRSIKLIQALPLDLPSIHIDAVHMRALVAELIYNAVDAMPEGGTITISGSMEGEMLVLRFTDTGIGMDETTKRRTLEPFFTTKGIAGTGLGLSNSLSFVRRNGGDIKVQSLAGHGTTVSIYLPAEEGSSQEKLPFEAGNPARILVVAEKQEVRDLLDRVLHMDGHETVTTPGDQKALALVRENPSSFDLFLVDLTLQDKPLLRSLRESIGEDRIVYFSGWGKQDKTTQGQPVESDLTLLRPFSTAQIIATVRTHLERHIP